MDQVLEGFRDRLNGVEMIASISGQSEDFNTLMTQLEHEVNVITAYLQTEVNRCESAKGMLNDFEQFNRILDVMESVSDQIPAAQTPATEDPEYQEPAGILKTPVRQVRFAPEFIQAQPEKRTQLPSLTEKQMKAIPRYLMTLTVNAKNLAKVNGKIAILNKIFAQKGYVTHQDLKQNGWVWDANGKSVIQILRHLHLLQETRSNSQVIYKLA